MVDAPLASWHDRTAKRAIIDLITRVTDESSPEYTPPSARIATVDNDGTLWCEKPTYVQFDFLIRRFRELAAQDPTRALIQPYKAAREGDLDYFVAYQQHLPELVAAIADAYAGITPEEFEQAALAFFEAARHPRFAVPYAELTYQPMHQLLAYLRANDFKVFIATGGGRDFVRAIAEEIYGVSREYVVGSTAHIEYKDGRLRRVATIEFPIDDGPGKPPHIYSRIGRAPVLAIGNSDGDFEMLEFARFGMLIRHDDAEREYAYDAGSERALAAAAERGWVVVSMRDDWTTVFGRRA